MDPELQALLDRLLADPQSDGYQADGYQAVTAEDLADLTDADLAALRAAITAAAESTEDDGTDGYVAALNRIADAQDAVADLQDQRATQAAERQTAAQAARERITGRTADPEPEGDEDELETPAEPERQPEPVAASGRRAPLGDMARRRASNTTVRDRQPEPVRRTPVPLVAAGGAAGVALGTPFGSIRDVAEALNARIGNLGYGGAQGEKLPVARAQREYAPERFLTNRNDDANTQKLGAVTNPEALGVDPVTRQPALVAAGGFCAPAEVDYTVDVLGVTDRPVRDALPSFGADRGKISFRQNLAFVDYAGAVSTWTEQNDIDAATAGGADPTKPCLDIACPGLSAAQVDAVTLCLNFRNFTSRFDPEGTAAAIRGANIAFARYSENRLLANMRAFAIDVTSPATGLGALRDLFAAFDHLFAYAESRWRLTGVRMRAAIPTWVVRLIALDQARGMHGGNLELLGITAEQINTWLRARGVEPVWHLDGMAAQASSAGVPAVAKQFYDSTSLTDAAALPNFPDSASIVCWYEGDLSYLDAGTLDLGVVRDQTSMANNSYKTFMEEFNGLAFRGQEMYHLVAVLQPRGGQAGTVDMSAFSD